MMSNSIAGIQTAPSVVGAPVTMTFDEWAAQYRPITNTLDPNAAMCGIMFETFGAEVNFVVATHAKLPARVWTVIESDEEELGADEDEPAANRWFVIEGFHYVNRLGYLITEVDFVSANDGSLFEVEYA
jgi:hypothetical protein